MKSKSKSVNVSEEFYAAVDKACKELNIGIATSDDSKKAWVMDHGKGVKSLHDSYADAGVFILALPNPNTSKA